MSYKEKDNENRPKSLKEQYAEAADKSFKKIYASRRFWEDKVYEHFEFLHKKSLRTRFVRNVFSRNIRLILQECYDKEMTPKETVNELSKFCTWL